ncbi:hypothetical protein DASB73_020330 [Starmerella bacillaris]|uniref:Alpha-ketoglutarate-dependent dioxygenase AlkB-like domain-containing protein n=1 Tax=Starmerella bacillaris TaxID=1247836 RepID=A0AAV5RI72_STABA|nr:hypothetical protein DASB73_020330 [Starmerella bacillaris]
MEDYFKPLYKTHRKLDINDIQDNVFDPRLIADEKEFQGFHLRYHDNQYWEIVELPGARIYPDTLSADQQKSLVSECIQEYLQSPEHLTNLDAHYALERPLRFFETDSPATVLTAENSSKSALMRNKIRWITLGGQYNWTEKVYPSFTPGEKGCPIFPDNEARAVANTFGINAEAAIVNFYTQGDILSPHQDVAELSKNDLISMSLGCSSIFYLGAERYGYQPLPIVLRSGDIIVMGGESRDAWHGVGRIFKETCPDYLQNLDLGDGFQSWMKDRRININLRQMN